METSKLVLPKYSGHSGPKGAVDESLPTYIED